MRQAIDAYSASSMSMSGRTKLGIRTTTVRTSSRRSGWRRRVMELARVHLPAVPTRRNSILRHAGRGGSGAAATAEDVAGEPADGEGQCREEKDALDQRGGA